jgi:hypothetical protein
LRYDVIRFSAVATVIFLVLAVVSFLLTGVADLYSDDDELGEMLQDIDDNDVIMAIGALCGMASSIFLLALPLGLFYAVRDADRPYAVLAGGLFALAGVFLILSFGAVIMLLDTASSFVEAGGSGTDAILQDAKLLQNVWLVFFFGIPMGVATLATGVLMLRTDFFHRYFTWFTLVVGVAGILSLAVWFIFLPGIIIWLLGVAATMWRRAAQGLASPASASAPA